MLKASVTRRGNTLKCTTMLLQTRLPRPPRWTRTVTMSLEAAITNVSWKSRFSIQGASFVATRWPDVQINSRMNCKVGRLLITSTEYMVISTDCSYVCSVSTVTLDVQTRTWLCQKGWKELYIILHIFVHIRQPNFHETTTSVQK
jgi:hypothetical protein